MDAHSQSSFEARLEIFKDDLRAIRIANEVLNRAATMRAVEAAEMCASVLSGERRQSVLFTWRGERGEFGKQGFRLSRRGGLLPAGSRTHLSELARLDCPVCGDAPR